MCKAAWVLKDGVLQQDKADKGQSQANCLARYWQSSTIIKSYNRKTSRIYDKSNLNNIDCRVGVRLRVC